MRRTIIVVASALATMGAVAPAGAQVPPPSPTQSAAAPSRSVITVARYRKAARHVYRYSVTGVGDYHARPKVTHRQRARLLRMRGRARGPVAHHRMLKITRHRKEQWRFHRYIDQITPWGEWAIPDYIVMCESGGVYTRWNTGGSGASGAYQFLGSTWLAEGGGQYAKVAAAAPPWAQHIVAARYYHAAGSSPWSCA